jgi:hypothetical protein
MMGTTAIVWPTRSELFLDRPPGAFEFDWDADADSIGGQEVSMERIWYALCRLALRGTENCHSTGCHKTRLGRG